MNALMQRRIQIFKSNKRAYFSAWILLGIFLLSLLAPLIANDHPLVLMYKDKLYFPPFETISDAVLDGNLPTEADFADNYTRYQIHKNGWMVMPPVPYRYDSVDYFSTEPFPASPSFNHWLGTDDQGRDVLARLIYALRISLLFGLILTFFSVLIGVIVGAVQGYFGGRTDLFIGRFLEIWGSLPQLFILIIVSSLIAPGFLSLLIVLLLFSWTSLTGVVRAEFLRARNLEFVLAAKALGVSNARIMFRHILPNAVIATITFVPFILSEAIVALTALDFLGFGLPYEYPSLGDLVRQGKDNLQAPWIGLSIFIVLATLLTLLIFIGEGVRDAFDARKNK